MYPSREVIGEVTVGGKKGRRERRHDKGSQWAVLTYMGRNQHRNEDLRKPTMGKLKREGTAILSNARERATRRPHPLTLIGRAMKGQVQIYM